MGTIDLLLLGALAATTASPAPSETLPDPTRPYQYSQAVDITDMPAAPEARQWHLSGLQVRNGLKRAILNGKLVKEGDQIGSATVTAIGASDVTISVDHKLVIVRLLLPPIKEAVAAVHKEKRTESK